MPTPHIVSAQTGLSGPSWHRPNHAATLMAAWETSVNLLARLPGWRLPGSSRANHPALIPSGAATSPRPAMSICGAYWPSLIPVIGSAPSGPPAPRVSFHPQPLARSPPHLRGPHRVDSEVRACSTDHSLSRQPPPTIPRNRRVYSHLCET